MDYSLLPGEKAPKTKRPSPLVIILLVAVCCLAAWNTYLTLDRAEFEQLKDELQQGLIEEYLKNTFHALQSRHYHHNNDNRSKRSVDGHSEGFNMVASLIETELKDVCSDVCPSGPPGPMGPVGPPGSVAKPPGCVIEEGYRYNGHDIPGKLGISVRDADHCAYLCAQDNRCKFWTFGPLCFLKTSASGKETGKNAVSGSKECGEAACEAPWSQLSTGCYWFMEVPMTFDEAQEFCQSKKSKMVEIESEEENSVIIQELSKLSMQNIFYRIGLSDAAEEGDWEWTSSGKNPVFTNWRLNEPNNYGNEENCAILGIQGKWNDYECNTRSFNKESIYALCEK